MPDTKHDEDLEIVGSRDEVAIPITDHGARFEKKAMPSEKSRRIVVVFKRNECDGIDFAPQVTIATDQDNLDTVVLAVFHVYRVNTEKTRPIREPRWVEHDKCTT